MKKIIIEYVIVGASENSITDPKTGKVIPYYTALTDHDQMLSISEGIYKRLIMNGVDEISALVKPVWVNGQPKRVKLEHMDDIIDVSSTMTYQF